jgi:hypothetical protein
MRDSQNAHAKPCDQCKQTGLPILFTRYAAAYSATDAGRKALDDFKPDGKLKSQPGGVALKTAKYHLRMLRGGYLYICLKKEGWAAPKWLGYAVHPHGYLTQFDIDNPQTASADAACRPDAWGANRSLLWINSADTVTQFNYLFHPDPVDPKHLKETIQGSLGQFTQKLDVAAWAKGSNTSQDDTMPSAQFATKLLEFKALQDKALQQLGSEQTFGLMGCNPAERQWGDWEEEVVTQKPLLFDDAGRTEEFREIVKRPQLDYEAAHGPRLRGILAYLTVLKGAVVACDDAIGIAQELSMHHLTAAIPYTRWLQQADDKGVSNQFKQAASASIDTVRSGLHKAIMTAYDATTDTAHSGARNILYNNSALSSNVYHVPMPDGSVKTMNEQEHNRYVSDKLTTGARERERNRPHADQAAGKEAVRKTDALYDKKAKTIFDDLHTTQIEARDKLMDTINVDLQLWLKADALTKKALGRYNDKADPAKSADGLRCAGQLCAILLQMDSTPKGRQWYAALDIFTPGEKNLVWRMLSFNNKIVSDELKEALEKINEPLSYGEEKAKDAQKEGKQQKAIAKASEALKTLKELLKGADEIGEARIKLADPLNTDWMGRAKSYWSIGKAAKDNIASVLLVGVLARVKEMEISKLEANIGKAQVALLAHGMGSEAQRFVNSDLSAAVKGKRVPLVLGGLSMLSIVPKLAAAGVKQDARSFSDVSASVATAIGTVKGWRADFYNETVLKQLPSLVEAEQVAGKLEEATKELRKLKGKAATFTVAGSAVAVWWDVVDARTASNEKDLLLTTAYYVRAATGVTTIGTTVAGVFAPEAVVTLLARLNIYVTIVAAGASLVIGKLQGEAWVNWLLAQPFRVTQVRDGDKNAFIGKAEDAYNKAMPEVKDTLSRIGAVASGMSGVYVKAPPKPTPAYPSSAPESQVLKANTKAPFRIEAEMMNKLADVLSEMK